MDQPPPKILKFKRHIAAFAIILEGLTLAFWRIVVWTLLFCGLWMFQIPLMMGQIISVLTALLYLGGLFYWGYRDAHHLHWPGSTEIDRRLEQDSQLRHRPLTSFKDSLANPEKTQTQSLWNKARLQTRALLPRLKFVAPHAFMAKADPYGLRLCVLLFFIAGILVAGPGWNNRIRYGIAPFSFNDQAAMQRGVSLWITPPEYTRQPQIVFEGSGDPSEPVKIPAGSMVKITVNGGLGQPTLHIGEQKRAMDYAGDDSYIAEFEIPDGREIRVTQFMMHRGSWTYERIPDTPPSITVQDPETMPDGSLRFPMTLKDDYSVRTLRMTMRLDQEVEGPPIGDPVSETRSIISPAGQDFETAPLYDLTAHPWAGLPVVFEFTADDHIAHQTTSGAIRMVLPERKFQHPVAKSIINERTKLIWAPEDSYIDMAETLEELMARPDAYQHDKIVFLALRMASSRLFYDHEPDIETARAVTALLWDTALRIEDGNLTLAARNLRDAQNALEDALRNPETSQAEIAKLMNDLRQAMSEYFMELQKDLQKRMAEGQQPMIVPPEMLSQVIDPDALANFLDQLQAEMMNGNRSNAQEMLSQLQRMMDMVSPSVNAPLPQDMQMMAQGVNELQKLIESQEKLLERTQQQIKVWETLNEFQRSYGETIPHNDTLLEQWGLNDMPPPPSIKSQMQTLPPINTQDSQEEQEALRYILAQLMLEADEKLGTIPENMGKAEREMLSSSDLLGQNQPKLSVPHQELAIKHLKEAQKNMSQQFAARMQQMTGMAFGGSRMRYDPLGRPYGESGGDNPFPGAKIKIPDEAEKKRAHEILRELRKRSSEYDRPKAEREYYRRLLRQF